MNGSIVFLRADDPEEEAIVVDTDEGGSLVDPLRRDGDAAARLRDLGPQGAGLRGAGRGRRLPPLPRADADPPAALHRDHPRPQQLRPGRRPGGAGDRRCAATTAAAATRRWPSACAAEPARAILSGSGDAEAFARRVAVTLAGIALLAGLVLAVPDAARRLRGRGARRHRRGAQQARQPRRRRAAADPRPGADPRRRLLPGRDRRRRGRLRLRLLPGAGPDDGRLAALRAALLRGRPLGRAAAARPLVRRRALRANRGGDRARRRHPAARRAADPDRPLQPRLLRGRRRPRAALALRLDDRWSATCRSPPSPSTSAPASRASASPTRWCWAAPRRCSALLLGGHWIVRRQARRTAP